MLYIRLSYVTGVLYTLACILALLAPFTAAGFRGTHVPAAQELSGYVSLSPLLDSMLTTRMEWPDWLHVGLLAQWQAAAL
jgi:hypothetical protein